MGLIGVAPGADTSGRVSEILWVLHAASRFSRVARGWQVYRLDTRTGFIVGEPELLLLLAFESPLTVPELEMHFVTPIALARVRSAVIRFQELGFLVPQQDPSHDSVQQVTADWTKHGWRRAGEYCLATTDYPYWDYADATTAHADIEMMREYAEREPDIFRSNEHLPTDDDRVCPPPKQILSEMTLSLQRGMTRDRELSTPVSGDSLAGLMSGALGVLRIRKLRQANRAPAIRKTSPSGGSRHPTEGYLLTWGVDDLSNGVWHFCATRSVLHPIDQPLPPEIPARFGVDTGALLVLTSVFERNMYRYREPRTFRTVWLDAGHVTETVQLLATAYGHQSRRLYGGIRPEEAESWLRLDPYVEGFINAILIY